MSRLQDEKLKQIDAVAANLRQAKAEVDALFQTWQALRASLDEFDAQYKTHVGQLVEQREELQWQLDDCQQRLAAHDLAEEEIAAEPEPAVSDERPEPPPAEPGRDPVEEPPPDAFPAAPPPVADDTTAKKWVRKYFAKRWHPDVSDSQEELMKELNLAYQESDDVVDMLSRLPWDDSWVALEEGVSIGKQWERLVEWSVWLAEAQERIESQTADLRRHWNFAAYQEWESVNRATAVLTDWTAHIRDEIAALQAEVQECQADLAQLEAHHEPAHE